MLEASGLPGSYSQVFCQYKFWTQDTPHTVPPLLPGSGVGPDSTPLDGVYHFNYSHQFYVEVTEAFLLALENGALAVEVWGYHHSDFVMDNAIEFLSGRVWRGNAFR